MTNKRNTRTFEFDVMDAPALMRAFSIAACTAMMCQHKGAQQRLDHYKALMAQFVPDEAKHFDEEVWCEVGMALVDASSFHVTLEAPTWAKEKNLWHYDGAIVIKVGEREWSSERCHFKPGAPEVEAVYKILTDLAPLGCEGTFNNKKEGVRA